MFFFELRQLSLQRSIELASLENIVCGVLTLAGH